MSPLAMLTLVLFGSSLLAVLLIWSLFAPARVTITMAAPLKPRQAAAARLQTPARVPLSVPEGSPKANTPARQPTGAPAPTLVTEAANHLPAGVLKSATTLRPPVAAKLAPEPTASAPAPLGPDAVARAPKAFKNSFVPKPAVAPKGKRNDAADDPFEQFLRSSRE
jgi:hypothetical protein